MGLSVMAYEKISLLRACSVSEFTEEELDAPDKATLYVLDSFREAADGLVDGVYRVDGASFRFRAGSYSGYNVWRSQLAQLVGTSDHAIWKNPKPGPFVELINNADSEGTIGPRTSAKLAGDFAEWQSRADEFVPDDGEEGAVWFRLRYAEWRKAFELAAHGGAVELG